MGQTRNDKRTPYYTHPLAVEGIAIQLAKIYEDQLRVAYPGIPLEILIEYIRQVTKMHDLIEDTHITIDELINQGFHEIVVVNVKAITKHPVKGAESYLDYLWRVKAHFISRIAKLADLKHNKSDLKPGNMRDKYDLAEHFLAIY